MAHLKIISYFFVELFKMWKVYNQSMHQDLSWKTNICSYIQEFPMFRDLTNYFLCLRVHQSLAHPKVGGLPRCSPPSKTRFKKKKKFVDKIMSNVSCYLRDSCFSLTFWRRNYFFNFSTPCIWNVNNTGTKQVRIMKQTAFWREKKTKRIYRV